MKNYNEMKVTELRKIAREMGIKKYHDARKDYLLAEITKVEAEMKQAEEIVEIEEVIEEPVEEIKEADELIEKIVEATEPTKTVNDWIYRSLPKYVQKSVDYCDYVDGVYRIHLVTDAGKKEVANKRWRDASDEARSFCKNAK